MENKQWHGELLSMNIPTFIKQQYVDPKTGELTPAMEFYHQQLNQQLQFNYSQSGLVVPSLNTLGIDQASSGNNEKPNGTLFYNNETDEVQVKINGVVKTIQTA